jgi:RNA polymerase sigma-70 factor (ECF subfamily)
VDRFDGHSAFTTWMYRLVTNACLDELRRRRRRPVTGREQDVATDRPEADGDAGRQDPGEIVTRHADIDEALAQLRPEFRAVVVLRDVAGLDYSEIAEVLDLPAGTVRSRIARGRGHLARLLANHPEGNQPPPPERPTGQRTAAPRPDAPPRPTGPRP